VPPPPSNATISEDSFTSFLCRRDVLEFRVSMQRFSGCLQIFGSATLESTTLTMNYHDEGHFALLLEQDGVVTECTLTTTVEGASEDLDFFSAFRNKPTVAKVIVDSAQLADALQELEQLQGASLLTVLLSASAPFLRFSAKGHIGSVEVEFSDEKKSFQTFQVEGSNVFDYRLNLMRRAARGLSQATETFLRMNEDGMVCLQHKLVHSGDVRSYIEYVLLPEADSDDAEAGDDAGDGRDGGGSGGAGAGGGASGGGSSSGRKRRGGDDDDGNDDDDGM